ncbi:hypothetical protein AB835_07120 [Candidatus Endobugula sertula]|uniref:N-acetyltransferase domain-containing protein n=1 Tax=Candidatus Endobugula sertula TaxID=62101 RepID=A0A1D2QQ83_9GAMM|nr:hypothetical protein AB835_07120 [Candidatus Endobugula sertula]
MSETFTIINSTLDMVEELEAVQRASFPTMTEEELITAEKYAAQIERFPEGQLALVTDSGKIVASSTDFRTIAEAINFDHYEHRYIEVSDNNWLGHHQPDGDWLYGACIGVIPDYRRRGLSTMLYNARHNLVRRFNLRGQVTGGLLAGYGAYKNKMSVEDYVDKVIAGKIFDPTVSIQLKLGFTIYGIIQDYVDDPGCDNKAAFIVWNNPDYQP